MGCWVILLLIACTFAVTSTLGNKSWANDVSRLLQPRQNDEYTQCLADGSQGNEYRGTVSVTARRHRCLRWNWFDASRGIGSHNYCRNPDNNIMPWCRVRRGSRIVREFCNIPKCPAKPTPSPEEQDTENTCGERSLRQQNKIIGGFHSSIESQPWIASIFKRGLFHCGGTLISPCWVLTAAHCFTDGEGKDVGKYTVFLGKKATNETDPLKEQMFRVTKVVIHQDYDFTKEIYNNDIALLQIENSEGNCAHRTNSVRTVCLPPAKQMMPYGAFCRVAGYGSEQTSPIKYSRYLKEAYVKLISDSVCMQEDYYGKSDIPLTENMFCAGSPTWEDDACQGDSGGPLVCEVSGRVFLYGIVSWGDGCANKFKPGVYTKVTNYNEWIAIHTRLRSFTVGRMFPQKD
ncbi:plasminogen activator, urokinase a [Hoplias malabaricus]|uniref:plasminogen activator, urokinase a n=1 Tax=Hoplias malabaricus TaxID=27720 RepID=UPI00346214A0